MKDSSDVGDSLFGSGILSNCWSFNNISYGSSSVSLSSDDVATFSACEDDDWRAAVLEKILVHAEFVRIFCRLRRNSDDDVRRKATAWSIFSAELLQMVANAAADDDDDDDDGKSNNRRAVTKHLHSCGVIVLSHHRFPASLSCLSEREVSSRHPVGM